MISIPRKLAALLIALALVPSAWSQRLARSSAPPIPDTRLREEPGASGAESADVAASYTLSKQVYVVFFTAGAGGDIYPGYYETVVHGGSTTPHTAVPDPGHRFDHWVINDTVISTANPLTVTNITEETIVLAVFADIVPVVPMGVFEVVIPPSAFAAGAAVWDVTGQYETFVGPHAVRMDLHHSAKGKVTGTGHLLPEGIVSELFGIPLTAKGSTKAKGAPLVFKLTLKGRRTGIPEDPDAKASAALGAVFSPSSSPLQLVAPGATVAVALGEERTASTERWQLPCPPGMDGGYTLLLDLSTSGTAVVGHGTLTLGNGRAFLLAARGKYGAPVTSLNLKGGKPDADASGISLVIEIHALADGTAPLQTLSGKAFGQTLSWKR